MANYIRLLHILLLLLVAGFGVLMMKCKATLYIVGDNAGWEISTDYDSWLQNKTFHVGDVLLFQYSSYHSLNEVTKESFNNCNLTNPISSSSSGNTSIPLTTRGERYFVCGNKLHCFGGMKLQVTTVGGDGQNSTSEPNVDSEGAKAGAPLPGPSSKNNLPPTSSASVGFFRYGRSSLLLILCLRFLISYC